MCIVDPAVQHIWEPSADASLVVAPDPRGNTLGLGNRVAVHSGEALAMLLTPSPSQ
jgi:hypothetical protein